MSDLIDRQAVIDAICKACSVEGDYHKCDGYPETNTWCDELVALRAVPSAQPTLYGYSIEHLAFIASVMEKENVPPEKVIEILTDIGRVVGMILAEQKEIMEREVNR